MNKISEFIKGLTTKNYLMVLVIIVAAYCAYDSWSNGQTTIAILSFVSVVIPIFIWHSDNNEAREREKQFLKLKEELKALLESEEYKRIDNPEWLKVLTDAEGKVIGGIKKDGSVEWYSGVPEPIRKELDELKNEIVELKKK